MHASVGISSTAVVPHSGHVMAECSLTDALSAIFTVLVRFHDPDAQSAKCYRDGAEKRPEPRETQPVGPLHGVRDISDRGKAGDRDAKTYRRENRGDDDAQLGGDLHRAGSSPDIILLPGSGFRK